MTNDMRILAIDTSTVSCSVAVIEKREILSEITSGNGQTHSKHLMSMIHNCLELAGMELSGIDGFAFTTGPGSFTGLRIGISTALGLAAATDKPIAGVSGLDALAMQSAVPDMIICPMIDARRDEVYFACYRWIKDELVKDKAEHVLPPEIAINDMKSLVRFSGNGAMRYQSLIISNLGELARFAPECQNIIRASTIGWMGMKRFERNDVDDIFRFEPMYIRKPDAKIMPPLFDGKIE